jgi:putative nucleotidyltransferase with HDIG domain
MLPGKEISDGAPRTLPLLPSSVMRILRLAPDAERYFDELLALLQEDPPLASRLLAAANSAASGPACPITTLRGGLTRLGARQTAMLVTAVGVMEVFLPSTEPQRRMWRHSVEVALGARFLTLQIASGELDPEEAYLAGLLHDIGRFVMFSETPQHLASVEERGWSTGTGLLRTEREIFGTDHTVLGSEACRAWGLPTEIVAMVANHHAGLRNLTTLRPRVREAIAVVQTADSVSLLLAFNRPFREGSNAQRARALHAARGNYARQGRWCTPEILAEAAELMQNGSEAAMRDLGLADG